MDATPDYSKCSLRELRDVAARIDKTKYPERYALVLRELERHESAGDDASRFAQRPLTANDYFAVFLFWAGGAFLGFVAGVLIFVAIYGQYSYDLGYAIMMFFFGFVGSLIGGIAGLIRGMKRIRNR